jgi:alkylated DNA repair dioxygenase AlkB
LTTKDTKNTKGCNQIDFLFVFFVVEALALGVGKSANRPDMKSMSQLPLFSDRCVTLLDQPSAKVTYWPTCVPPCTADAWFATLLEDVDWQSDRRMMYDREVDVPRLMAGFRLDDPDVPATLIEAAAVVRGKVDATFNSVGLNLYRDGRDSVAAHHDRLGGLVVGEPIALLSLGGLRRMTISAQDRSIKPIHVELESGSLLVMDYASQLHFLHGIAKTRAPVAARISLAFRVRKRDGRPA